MKKVLTIIMLNMVLLLVPFTVAMAVEVPANPDSSIYKYYMQWVENTEGGSVYNYIWYLENPIELTYQSAYAPLNQKTYNVKTLPRYKCYVTSVNPPTVASYTVFTSATTISSTYSNVNIHPTTGTLTGNFNISDNLGNSIYQYEPSQSDIENYNFTGMKILSPDIGTTINKSVYELTVNANIPHTIQWAMGGKEISEQIAMITSEIKSTLTIEDNSTRITPIGDIIIDWQGQTTTNYKLQIKVMLPNKISGTNNLNVGANFKTKFNWFSAPAIIWYNDTSTFTSILPIDTNNDGIDDNTGNNIIIDNSQKPNRDNYVTGMEGDIQFYWDTFVYYITFPFRLIRDSINMLFTEIADLMNVLTAGSDKLTTLFQWVPTPIMRLAWMGVISSIIFTILRR